MQDMAKEEQVQEVTCYSLFVGLRPHLHLQFIQWYRCDSGERSSCVTVLKVAEDFGLSVGVGRIVADKLQVPMQVPTNTWSAGGMHLCMYLFK